MLLDLSHLDLCWFDGYTRSPLDKSQRRYEAIKDGYKDQGPKMTVRIDPTFSLNKKTGQRIPLKDNFEREIAIETIRVDRELPIKTHRQKIPMSADW